MDKNKGTQMHTFDDLTFKIDNFEGPLDLLLHLIKKNEMDIYDIPMTKITSQYIDYLHRMKKMELDIAGEYFVTAAMLLNIKSRMLLPTQQTGDNSDETTEDLDEDPRDSLVQQLLTHQLYQKAAEQLQSKFAERSQHFEREPALVPAEAQLGKLVTDTMDVSQLEKAFKKVLVRQKKQAPIQRSVTNDKYTIKEEMTRLEQKVNGAQGPVQFDSLFSAEFEIELYVTTFVALLELVKKGHIKMFQSDNFKKIEMISGDKDAFKSSKN